MRSADDWNQRYVEGRTGWDLGQAPPALERAAMARLATASGPLSVLVPGAGRAHDARGWARHGHRVIAVDIAPDAVAEARKLAKAEQLKLEVTLADVTELPDPWANRFDLVWEQTCLCALPVDLREPYLNEVARVLKPRGEFLALLWNHGKPKGPPHDMTPALVEQLLGRRFEIVERTPVSDSPGERAGETLYTARLR